MLDLLRHYTMRCVPLFLSFHPALIQSRWRLPYKYTYCARARPRSAAKSTRWLKLEQVSRVRRGDVRMWVAFSGGVCWERLPYIAQQSSPTRPPFAPVMEWKHSQSSEQAVVTPFRLQWCLCLSTAARVLLLSLWSVSFWQALTRWLAKIPSFFFFFF